MVRLAGAVVVSAMLFLAVGAGAAIGDGAQRASFPISFTLGSDCSQLASGQTIVGTGTALFIATPSGMLNSVINGTATDSNGGAWRFNYTDSIRPVGDNVSLTDHFNLVGSGGTLKLHSHFVIEFDPSGNPVRIKQVTGDPFFCDPI